jgi:hypothetical protein
MSESTILTSDPRDGTRRAMEHQERESRHLPIQVERVAWPNATGNDRVPVLDWNPGNEAADASKGRK